MLKITVDVFGEYTRGIKKGHVNPKAVMQYTGHGVSVRDCVKKLADVNGDLPIYKVVKVEKLAA